MKNRKGVGNDILGLALLLIGFYSVYCTYTALAKSLGGPALSLVEFFGLWYVFKSIVAWLMPRPAQK